MKLQGLLLLAACVWANTETYLIRVPNYYNIPIDDTVHNRQGIVQLNQTSYAVDSHPVLDISNYNVSGCGLELPYNYTQHELRRVFVKINNYNNETFDANDLISAKVCWPATSPFDFQIGHRFLQTREMNPDSPVNQLNVYLEIQYGADFYSMSAVDKISVPIQLVISKLPNRWVPIPIELYDFIVYAMDLVLLSWLGSQYVLQYIRSI